MLHVLEVVQPLQKCVLLLMGPVVLRVEAPSLQLLLQDYAHLEQLQLFLVLVHGIGHVLVNMVELLLLVLLILKVLVGHQMGEHLPLLQRLDYAH